MDETHIKALSIFNPNILDKKIEFEKGGSYLRFAHYTSVDAAMNIIKNREIWLRNVQCMNDYMEVRHGIECLAKAYNHESVGLDFRGLIDSIFPNIAAEIASRFDDWSRNFQTRTFIACVSEHKPLEDEYGRLSMWRAYGGKQSVALILNPTPFFAETDIFHAYSRPVLYSGSDAFLNEFSGLSSRIKNNSDFILSLGKECVKGYLFEIFKTYALCLKHPGFLEEREWRVFYTPDINKSEHIDSTIQTINGVPQEVCKFPLKNIPEHKFMGAAVPELIDRIIIGPNSHQSVLFDTFKKLLEDAGCENAGQKIHFSNIPLR